MDEDGFAESLKLDMKPVSDGCFRETKIKRPDQGSRQTTEITLWNRTVCLTSSPADNVFLYESLQKDLRVFKRLRRQKSPANYRRELSVMERVLKEVKYVCQKNPEEKVSNVIAGHIKRSFLLASLVGSHQDYIHFVLEYCPYGDISTYSAPLSELQAWCVCNQLMEGLSVLHQLDITHRDIKPEVVFSQ